MTNETEYKELLCKNYKFYFEKLKEEFEELPESLTPDIDPRKFTVIVRYLLSLQGEVLSLQDELIELRRLEAREK